MEAFGNFIDQVDLINLPTMGKKFSWSNVVGGVASCLDIL